MHKVLTYRMIFLLIYLTQITNAQEVLDSAEVVVEVEEFYEKDEEYYEDEEYEDYEDEPSTLFNEENNKLWRTEKDSIYNTRDILESKIDWYRKQSEFKYKEQGGVEKPDFNWLDQLFEKIKDLFDDLFGFSIPNYVFQIIKWLLIISALGVLLYYLFKFLGVKLNWQRKKSQSNEIISFEELEENLEEVDFSELIENAIKKRSYRVAVRLLFLKNLQSLAKRELIEWEIDKTNNDYKYELSHTKIINQFEEVVYLFEHIWYGNFDLSEHEFQEAIQKFRTFDKRLGYEK